MRAKRLSKLILSSVLALALGFATAVSAPIAANAACGGSMPSVQLISDPIMYSGLPTYNANYIGYKLTGGSAASSNLSVKLQSFGGSARVQLATSQADTQTVGAVAIGEVKYVYFLARLGSVTTAAETHDVVLTDGGSTCTHTTTINPATSVSPAATSNNSNKVISVTIGTPPSAVGGTISVTVKGQTGQVGTNEGMAFAPISNAAFPANKWALESVTIKLNQDSNYANETYTSNKLYLPYTDASYSPAANLGAIDGNYTAVYVFKLLAATGTSTEMKPIQYVGNVYTGSMPGGSAPVISTTGAAAAAPTITSNQTVAGVVNTAITSTTAFTASGFSAGASLSYTISPALPTGLAINAGTGVVSGTPTGTLSSTVYTVTATNTNNNAETATATVTIEVTSTPQPALTPQNQTVSGTAGTAISATSTITHSNFSGTPTFTVSPSLPAGLSINSSTGVISGTATASSASATYTITGTYSAETATAAVTISISAAAAPASAAPELDRKVTICHRTHAVTNPYVRITVDYNSVNKKSGHQIHDEIFAGEHVFKAGIYVRAKDKDWGDIIPADPTGYNRWQPLNWTTLGAAIYNGTVAGCPSYDPVKYYNALREAGVPEKQIKKEMADLETEQSEANPSRTKKDTETLKYTGTNTKALQEENDKVTICHRTNSVTNPYVRITVAAESVYKNAGHYGHDEIYDGHHVFDSSVIYPNNRKDWGDIIPADPTGKNRWQPLNMTTLGKAIYDGSVDGCGEKTTQQLYNELREEGKTKKEIIEELEKQKNIDVDPKDVEELTYTGTDPKTQKTEPKEPVLPAAVKVPDQSLSGIVWLDTNEDGLKDDDEPYMAAIDVTLTGKDKDGKDVKITAKTDSKGFYVFPSIEPGDWQAVATIPQDLKVTYDSHLIGDGTVVATVPVGSSAFTWVGLVGNDPKVTRAFVAALTAAGPGANVKLSISGKLIVVPAKKASAGSADATTELAATGSNQLTWLVFGLLLMLCGALAQLTRRAYQN